MSFPTSGQAIPAALSGNNISLDNLRLSYVNNGNNGAWSVGDGKDISGAQVSFSHFNGATFTSGGTINGDGSQPLSIGSHFCDNTFGSSATTYFLQINNEGTINSFNYEISNISSMISGNQGPNLLGPMFMGSNSSGELEYTDTNNEITITITDNTNSSVTVNNINAGSGLSVAEFTPIANGVITLTLNDTGSSGSPLILGISID